MATAIEYGLVAAVAVTVVIWGTSSIAEKVAPPPPAVAQATAPAQPERFYFPTEPNRWAYELIDRKNNCHYVATPNGLSIIYRKDGKVDCPES